jgi:transcription antitermination factor NusG
VKFHPVDDFRLVKYTRGVKTIVHFGDRIIPLSEEFIDFIKARLEDGVATLTKRSFRKGERIIVTEGPFKGLTGIFEKEMDGRERVAILLEGINYYARMEIDRDLIDSA